MSVFSHSKLFAVVLIFSLWMGVNPDVAAQDQKAASGRSAAEETGSQKIEGDKKTRVEVTDEDRARVMKFAADNHPELAGLLEQLQKSRPSEFARATRELKQQIQILDRVRERSPAKYSEQLASWKRDSQIRILMARWAHSNDPMLEEQIRDLLKIRREAKVAQLKADRIRLEEQLLKLDEQLRLLDQPMDAYVNEEWEQLARRNRKAGSKK